MTATGRPPAHGAAEVCPTCGWAGALIWVHGHGQCPRCGMVLAPCCEGAPIGEAESDLAPIDAKPVEEQPD